MANLIGKKRRPEIPYDGFIRLGTFVLMTYFLVMLARAIHKNYLFDNQVDEIKAQIELTERQNEELKQLAEYYRSNAYKEKQARERLNLKHPDENVLVFSQAEIPRAAATESAKTPEEKRKADPPVVQWWHFFFNQG